MNINPLFTRENINLIKADPIVKEDLCSFISEKLKKAGIYFRITSRLKSYSSIFDKLTAKNYGQKGSEYENKKLQDLIGIRIILYYLDDSDIVKEVLDDMFSEPGIWESTETTDSEFKAQKENGIFKIPHYLKNFISCGDLGDFIDDTFEIQIRTNAFEGWHEVEHDLKYKGKAFGGGSEGLSRQLNAILATLELCDYSLIKVTDDLAGENLKNGCWEEMLRSHFRIRLTNDELYPEIVKVFDLDRELPDKFYDIDRKELVNLLLHSASENKGGISVNYLIEILNCKLIKNEMLFRVIEKINSKKKQEIKNKKHFEPFKTLKEYPVFISEVEVDTKALSCGDAFKKSCAYVYGWLKSRFANVFSDLPDELESITKTAPGYSVDIIYDSENMRFYQRSTHVDHTVAERIWISNTRIEVKEGRVFLSVRNCFANPQNDVLDSAYHGIFSRPNFYGEIADNMGIKDVIRLKEEVIYINNKNFDTLTSLISKKERTMPVVVFIVNDRTWTDSFDTGYFSYLVGYYTHVFEIETEEEAIAFAERYGLNLKEFKDSITVFYPGKSPVSAYKNDILGASYEVIKMDTKKYWNETGCRAYRRFLIKNIRENMIRQWEKRKENTEIWDACDKDGNVIDIGAIPRGDGDTIPAGWYHRVVCIYTVAPDGKILLTQRAEKTRNAGMWEVTRGSVVTGETPVCGARRELNEETGLDCLLEDLKPLYVYSDDAKKCVYFAYLNLLAGGEKITLQKEETKDYMFVSADEFKELIEAGKCSVSEGERFEKFMNVYKGNI